MLEARPSIEELVEAAGRFEIRRRLGAGGMGVVYEAYDRDRDVVVALKTLRRINAGSLYLFKQEFRALADVSHPNLVTLYELLVSGEQWFFTMELLEGTSILAFARGERSSAPGAPRVEDAANATPTATATATAASHVGPEKTQPTIESPVAAGARDTATAEPVSAEILRPLLSQLAEGLSALHASGHLHCDLKPSNILVTTDGRVVILDYGVIVEMVSRSREGARAPLRGTPAYTSPEQAAGDPPTPASDWYSVGVILYQALTGRRPFRGTATEMLELKQITDPVAPLELCGDADSDLADLCMRLLARDPLARPTGPEVLAGLDMAPDTHAGEFSGDLAFERGHADDPLVGRDRELSSLESAFDEVRRGRGVVVRVKGRSGMGKSSLVASFLDRLVERDEALILAGRCYERESVPHQAVDGLVDALCQYLLQLKRRDADVLMPVDVLAMARAFPVLGRVEAVAKARRRSTVAVMDPVELRHRAFAALRELLTRIAERQPLVLFIDDLQWGDVDSAPFLSDLLQAPAPPLLLIASYRSEEVESSALLQTLLEPERAEASSFAQAREISVGRLSLLQARELAHSLLVDWVLDSNADASVGPTGSVAEQVARESGGNPFFVHELVRFIVSQDGGEAVRVPPLSQVLLGRAEALTPAARELVRVVAVAGKPIPEAVARRAAGTGDDYPRALVELRAAHLVRTTEVDGRGVIETYHDRIRESLASSLPGEASKSVHLRIAESLRALDINDPEALAMHYLGAGELRRASEFAATAADKAADALAFERAAAFYALALEHRAPDDRALGASLGRRLGDTLVNAGRGAEAPKVYLTAAALAGPQEARDLQVQAGSELLRAGRVEEGVDVLRRPLESAGIALARSRGRAAASLLFRRAHSRLRGLKYERREPAQIAPQTLTRIDACHAAAAGLAMVDPLRGAYAQTRHLMSALSHGDLFRIGRALTYEGGFLAIGGPRARKRVDRILATVHEIAAELDEPYLEAMHHTHSAFCGYQCGQWSTARDHALIAESTYLDRCTGSTWELSSVRLYGLWSLYWLGEFREFTRRTKSALRDARARGDLYATVSLNIGLPSFAGLVVDDEPGTRLRAEHAADSWSHPDYHLQHFWTAGALARCDLYAGDPISASERMEAQWPLLKRAFLLNVVMVRAETLQLRGRCALAAAMVSGERRQYLRLAGAVIRQLGKQDLPWCRPAADLLRAGIASVRGDKAAAMTLALSAEQALEAAETHAFAQAARRGRGVLLGGPEGDSLVSAADEWFTRQGVVRPERIAAMLAPGFVQS